MAEKLPDQDLAEMGYVTDEYSRALEKRRREQREQEEKRRGR